MTPWTVVVVSLVFAIPAVFGGFIISRRGAWPAVVAKSHELRIIMLVLGWSLLVSGSAFVAVGIVTAVVRS